MAMPKQRPLGVTILAILTILFGLALIFFGLALMALGAIGAVALQAAVDAGQIPGWIVGFLVIIGALILLFGIIGMAAGVGLWRLRPWAWWLTLIVGIFSIIFGAVSFQWISVALWLIIVIYLFVVRQHFGMGARAQTGMPPPA